MELHFFKYQGAGNDFVIVDNRSLTFDADNTSLVAGLCDRRFGVGADGLMLLQEHPQYDFEMRYFNSDGREASMCGNGGRCMAAFARRMGIAGDHTRFMAVDGLHEAVTEPDGDVNLRMADVEVIEKTGEGYFLNTGSPHLVCFTESPDAIDVEKEGRALRHHARYAPGGTNVNFVQLDKGALTVYTYERGVEAETLACGTGITASALCAALVTDSPSGFFPVTARGGHLRVSYRRDGERFTDIWLKGPALYVFHGYISL